MIFYYLDASAWVKRYCQEDGSDWIAGFFARETHVACSALGLIEVLATLARKRKARELSPAAFREKYREAERDFSLFHRVFLTAALLDVAQTLPARHALRGADTVHLASLIFLRDHILRTDDEAKMITCDKELGAAARESGFVVITPRGRTPGTLARP